MSGIVNSARVRFLSALCFSLAGAVLAVGAFTFSTDAERWLGLGIGGGCLALLIAVFAVRGLGVTQRLIDVILAPICIWTLVSMRTIALSAHGGGPGLVRWLGFSAGTAIGALGILSLLLHEMSVERDLVWAAERIVELGRRDAVAVHDFRDTSEREGNAFPRASG